MPIQPFISNPTPDFDRLMRAICGAGVSRRAHVVELAIDAEVLMTLKREYLHRPWVPLTTETRQQYYSQIAELYWLLGYDGVLEGVWRTAWVNHPALGSPKTGDTAGELSRGEREWAREGKGLIDSWAAFERFPWERIHADYRPYEILAKSLKPGMKLYASSSFFEHVLENLLGYEGLFYLMADDPALVEAVFTRWGEKVLDYYRQVADLEEVGAIWHADDLGYKTGTILSPLDLERYVFPWFRRFARVAHERGKPFLLHSCGELFQNGVIETLIDDIRIDALHSFQDVILPAGPCVARYGKRLGLLGGVDMDCLGRLAEADLRSYVRGILETCLPGRFALGTGNTVANYLPIRNYLAMLDEARRWNQENGDR